MKIKKIVRCIKNELHGEIDLDESRKLSQWLEKSERNKRLYAQIRDVDTLNNTSKCVIANKEEVYRKITKIKQRRLLVASVSAVAVFVVFFLGRWLLISDPIVENSSTKRNMAEAVNEVLFISGGETYSIRKEIATINTEVGILENNAVSEVVKLKSDKNRHIVTNKIVVPAGRTYKVELPDGTRVTLNARTTISFPSQFSEQSREVILDGEAFFDVTHDARRRFIVKTKQGETRVYGTKFNVKAYSENEVETVSLVSGRVVIGNGLVEQKLNPGEQAKLQKDSAIEVSDFDEEEVLGWEKLLFLFEDKPLKEITDAIEYWYDVKFKYTDENLKNICAYVKIKKTTSLHELLNAISSTNKVKFAVEGATIVISSN